MKSKVIDNDFEKLIENIKITKDENGYVEIELLFKEDQTEEEAETIKKVVKELITGANK